jgi:hypothetical protein
MILANMSKISDAKRTCFTPSSNALLQLQEPLLGQQILLTRQYTHPPLVSLPIWNLGTKVYAALRLPPTGKLPQRAPAAAHVYTPTKGCLFLTVNTDSHLCMYPRRLIPQHRECVNYDLCVASSTAIHTYGWLPLSLNLGLHWDFTWQFIVANITQPLISVDFLSHFGLLVDC